MKVLIQHNFITGLGDMYCTVTEYVNYISILKSIGYETELVVSFRENKYIDIIDFSEIFNTEIFKDFDKITYVKNPILEKEYFGLRYVYTPNLYHDPRPGQQLWDVFIDQSPEVEFPVYTPYHFLKNNIKPNIIPEFNYKIYEKENLFLNKINSDYNFFHIRMTDGKILNDNDYIMLDNFYKGIIETNEIFHIGSNNQQVISYFKQLNNIITYDFEFKNGFDNDYGYFNRNHFSKDESINRLHDNLSEMVSIRNAKKIYQYSEIPWISNFIYYPLIENKNTNLFYLIDKNFKKIN